MPRPGLSEEQFLEVAEELVNAGKTVTVSAVREVLGTGSYSTINAYLIKWKETRSRAPDLDIPPMPEAVQRSATTSWGIAYKCANELVRSERELLEQMKQGMAVEKQELAAEIARLEHKVAGKEDQLEALEVKYKKSLQAKRGLEDEVLALKVEKATLGERATNAEERVKSVESQLAQLTESLKALAPPSPSNQAVTSRSNPGSSKKSRPKSDQN